MRRKKTFIKENDRILYLYLFYLRKNSHKVTRLAKEITHFGSSSSSDWLAGCLYVFVYAFVCVCVCAQINDDVSE